MAKRATDHPALTPALRWTADMLCLWGLCAKSACRRGRTCNGEPRDCLKRYAPLAPEAARDGVKLMLDGLRLQPSYDALREEAPEEIAAVEDWCGLVRRTGASAGRPRYNSGSGADALGCDTVIIQQ